uniref:Uncharacterized protein n=1 Tax=Anguilla anguilla TaxID=7936 RepID=A0A0E9TPI0_ANGAN
MSVCLAENSNWKRLKSRFGVNLD